MPSIIPTRHVWGLRCLTLAVVPWLAAGIAQADAAPAGYTYVSIFGPPGMELFASGLNDSGQVAGTYCDFSAHKNIPCRGFIFEQGVLRTINPPGAVYSQLAAISNDGTAVGGYFTDFASSAMFGFTYKNGVYRSIGKASASTEIQAINNKGELAGVSSLGSRFTAFTIVHGMRQTADTDPFFVNVNAIDDSGIVIGAINNKLSPQAGAFVFRDGITTHLEIPGGTQVAAQAINKGGVIVGGYFDLVAGIRYGFVDQNSVITQLSFPARDNAQANGINNRGDIVGFGYSADGSPDEGWILHDGVYSAVAPPGAVNSQCDSINNKGQILGFNLASTGLDAAYLATPKP